MKYIIFGGTGFLGLNIARMLAGIPESRIVLYSRRPSSTLFCKSANISFEYGDYFNDHNFDDLLADVDVVFHLVSPSNLSKTNQDIPNELASPLQATCRMLDSCVRTHVGKVIFISSGGTVYGSSCDPPFTEADPCRPLSAYGLQKVLLEQVLDFYWRVSGLDYRIVRLSNPYGPLQNPEGQIGIVTKAISYALNSQEISLFGDGSVVRDFIFIDDVIAGISNILDYTGIYRVFNLGSGVGTSLVTLFSIIEDVLNVELKIRQMAARSADVPAVWLDMSRYREEFGTFNPIPLELGIEKTARYLIDGEL